MLGLITIVAAPRLRQIPVAYAAANPSTATPTDPPRSAPAVPRGATERRDLRRVPRLAPLRATPRRRAEWQVALDWPRLSSRLRRGGPDDGPAALRCPGSCRAPHSRRRRPADGV